MSKVNRKSYPLPLPSLAIAVFYTKAIALNNKADSVFNGFDAVRLLGIF